jgi:hypothetical protein
MSVRINLLAPAAFKSDQQANGKRSHQAQDKVRHAESFVA